MCALQRASARCSGFWEKGEVMENEERLSQKSNRLFSRIMVIIFALVLAVMIILKYFLIVPTEELSSGLIILIAILLVVALSESFDNFSIGNLITLKRRNNELKTEKDNLQTRYDTLQQSFFSLSANFSQNQVTHNINNYKVSMEKATYEETITKHTEEEKDTHNKKEHYRAKRISSSDMQEFCLKKYLERNNSVKGLLQSDIKLGVVGDPISEKSYVYDYYYQTPTEEVFIEITRTSLLQLLNYRLYNALCKIWWYNQRQNRNARLDLLLFSPNDTEDAKRYSENNKKNIDEFFGTATSTGLLNVIKIDANAEDIKTLQDMQ